MTVRKIATAFLVVYALFVIYVILISPFSGRYQPFLTPLMTLPAFLFALLHGSQILGWRRMWLLLGLTFGVSLLFESIGVATGLVYGSYHYTDRLGAKFLGLVPYLIPVAWFMMTYPAYIIAESLVPFGGKPWIRLFLLSAAGGVVMTSWDLAMDPLMVAGGHWVWEQPGAYFGIPIQNFWGWWLTIFVTFILYLSLGRHKPAVRAPGSGFGRLAIWSYAITGLSSVILDFQSGLPGPGLVGLFAMGPWVLFGWWNSLSKEGARHANH